MVDDDKGVPLLARVRAVRAKWSGNTAAPAALPGRAGGRFRPLSAQGKAPWQDFWQAGAPPAPVLEQTQAQIDMQRKLAKEEAKPPEPAAAPASASSREPTHDPVAARGERTARRNALLVGGGRMTWTAAALQGVIALLLSRAIGNSMPILAMLALYWLSLRVRRPLWVPYIVVMALIWATMAPH